MAAPEPIMINLLEVDPGWGRRQKNRIISAIVIIALLGGLGGVYYSAFSGYKQEQAINKELKAKIAQFYKLQAVLQASETFNKNLAAKQSSVAEVEVRTISYVTILEEIAAAVPSQVLVTKMEIVPHNIRISGYAPDHRELATFLSGLRESHVFKEVQLFSSEKESDNGEVNFVIEGDWEVGSR